MTRTLSCTRAGLWIAGLLGTCASLAQAQAVERVTLREPDGLSPTVFWVAASATFITASLGGFYAISVKDKYDRANLEPLISPARSQLRSEMQNAELTADVLLFSSLAMAIGTTVLAFYIDWSDADRAQKLAAAGPAPPRRTWW